MNNHTQRHSYAEGIAGATIRGTFHQGAALEDNAEEVAKAFVMNAAPDLLAALEDCLLNMEFMGKGKTPMANKARAAIYKAKNIKL